MKKTALIKISEIIDFINKRSIEDVMMTDFTEFSDKVTISLRFEIEKEG